MGNGNGVSLAEPMIAGVYKKNNNFTVVKHYNTFKITEEDAKQIERTYPQMNIYYEQFNAVDMVSAYEPFLTVIRDMYNRYYGEESIEAYIDRFDIYSLHRSVFRSLMKNEKCGREEELLLDEAAYEQEKMLQSIISILLQISAEHPVMLVLNNLNMAAHSTIRLLNGLFECGDNSGVLVYAAYSDLYPVPAYIAPVWDSYVRMLEDNNCILDGGVAGNIDLIGDGSSFNFESGRMPEYLSKLNDMYYLLDFAQAKYYLAILYQKIELEKISLEKGSIFEIYRLYALVSLFSDDISNALLLCDNLRALRDTGGFETAFRCEYISGLTQMYSGRLHAARDCARVCQELAGKEKNERCLFQAKLLELMVRMSGWHNIFFCKSNINVPQEFLNQAMQYHCENHLAYLYIYAFDNEVELFGDHGSIEERLQHFERGIELAKKLKNEYLLLTAYRKNIMLSSTHGLFEITNHYYYKSMEIIGDKDPFKLADIYNGLGYNSCAVEQYEKANGYYNQAIEIFFRLGQMNYVGETLYNMAINCMLAGEYQSAYTYLQNCMKIVNTLHLNDLRVCNISKILGLLALCAFKLKLYYNCRVYLDNTLQFLGHILNRDESGERPESLDLSYTACDDDIFLYYYVEALMRMESGELERAYFYMKTAQVYEERSTGNQFFSKAQFLLSFADLCRRMEKEEEARALLLEGVAYAKGCGASEKCRMMQEALEGRETEQHHEGLRLERLTIEEIQSAIRQAGVLKNYNALKSQMEFLTIWQKALELNGKTVDEMVQNALKMFMANFSIDVMLYIRYVDGQPRVCFDTKPTPLTDKQLEVITDYFSQYHAGFVTSKMRKNHVECNWIISLFGATQVCSMICLPYYVDEKIDSVFIMYINMKDNWNSPIIKYMLDESEYKLFDLMMRQLLDAVKMQESAEEIRRINSELEKSAITDYLTGLCNRSGFYGKIHAMLQTAAARGKTVDLSFLYIDLDNFKYYNDTFGHDVGDMIIREVSLILNDVAGEMGFATRFGGDEFIVTLFLADREKVYAAGRRILDTILSRNAFVNRIEKMTGGQVEIPEGKQVSCSIGIAQALHAAKDEEISAAIRKADEMLYAIKHTTKGDVRIS